MGQTPLRVFISYKWEDYAHNKWVEKFATDLRIAGIDAILDRWEVRLGDSLIEYMTSKIKEADAVLFISWALWPSRKAVGVEGKVRSRGGKK